MLQDSPIYVYIPARDIARARRFYEDKLGLRAKEETNGGVVYEFGGGTAAFLYLTPNAGSSQASQAFWSVADVDAEIQALQARGVQFERYADMPGERSAQGAVTVRPGNGGRPWSGLSPSVSATGRPAARSS